MEFAIGTSRFLYQRTLITLQSVLIGFYTCQVMLGFFLRFLSGRLELELVGRYRRGLLRRVPDCGLSPAAGDDAINQAVFQRLTRLQDIIAVDIALDARPRLARRCG